MIEAGFTVEGGAQVREAFRRAESRLMDRWDRTTRRHALRAVRIWQQQYRGAARTSATATRQGTGALRASITQRVARTAQTTVEALIGLYRFGAKGKALLYGGVHEEGATIRSSSGKMLAIPLAAVRSPSGQAPPPRSFADAFVIRKGPFGSGGIIARKVGDQIIPLYALRRSVTIPARPLGGAINAAVKQVEPDFLAGLEADAAKLLEAVQ